MQEIFNQQYGSDLLVELKIYVSSFQSRNFLKIRLWVRQGGYSKTLALDMAIVSSPKIGSKKLWSVNSWHFEGGVRVCGDAALLDFWCGFLRKSFILRRGNAVSQNQAVCGFRNVRVILLRFAVFFCYSVQCLYVILCGFAVFKPPLCRPPFLLL